MIERVARLTDIIAQARHILKGTPITISRPPHERRVQELPLPKRLFLPALLCCAAHVLDGATDDLLVSPQHRLLFTGYKAEILFGFNEVLVAAKYLIYGRDVVVAPQATVTYFHLMLDQHHVIYADGAATESFHAGDVGISAISDQSREEMYSVFPELRANPNAFGRTARQCLKPHEARLLLPTTAPIRLEL